MELVHHTCASEHLCWMAMARVTDGRNNQMLR